MASTASRRHSSRWLLASKRRRPLRRRRRRRHWRRTRFPLPLWRRSTRTDGVATLTTSDVGTLSIGVGYDFFVFLLANCRFFSFFFRRSCCGRGDRGVATPVVDRPRSISSSLWFGDGAILCVCFFSFLFFPFFRQNFGTATSLREFLLCVGGWVASRRSPKRLFYRPAQRAAGREKKKEKKERKKKKRRPIPWIAVFLAKKKHFIFGPTVFCFGRFTGEHTHTHTHTKKNKNEMPNPNRCRQLPSNVKCTGGEGLGT